MFATFLLSNSSVVGWLGCLHFPAIVHIAVIHFHSVSMDQGSKSSLVEKLLLIVSDELLPLLSILLRAEVSLWLKRGRLSF